MQVEQQQDVGLSRGGSTVALIEALRTKHWIKNAFVAAPLLFSGRFVHAWAWWQAGAAVAAFCMLSSGIYLINDIFDVRHDRSHPVKSAGR